MTDKELLELVEAREKLEAKGYRKEVCPSCKGLGFIEGLSPSGGTTMMHTCQACEGKGRIWQPPIT